MKKRAGRNEGAEGNTWTRRYSEAGTEFHIRVRDPQANALD